MKQLIFILVLISHLNVFCQDNQLIDVRNAEIHDIMKNLQWRNFARSNAIYSFKFNINQKGEAVNIIMPENINESIRITNLSLFSEIRFQPIENSTIKVSFKVFATISSPSVSPI
jgi:hypothetical protein